jgi:hypothetical protein
MKTNTNKKWVVYWTETCYTHYPPISLSGVYSVEASNIITALTRFIQETGRISEHVSMVVEHDLDQMRVSAMTKMAENSAKDTARKVLTQFKN